jgi:uncharacterized OsmC-like protein
LGREEVGESPVVRQDSSFHIEVAARDPHDHDSEKHGPVEDIVLLTPYGMMLASLASCTSTVLLTYAQHHGLALEQVEVRATYDRLYGEDCKTCTDEYDFEEAVGETIELVGELSESEKDRSFAVSKQCPIHKILSHGIEVRSSLAPASSTPREGID